MRNASRSSEEPPEAEEAGVRQLDAPFSKRRKVETGSGAPTQPSPAPPGPVSASPPGRAATGWPREKIEREAAGARPPPAARTAAPAPLPPTLGCPRPPSPAALGAPSRSASRPPPGPHPPPRTTGARQAQPWFRGGCSSAGRRGTDQQDASDHHSTSGAATPRGRPIVASAGTVAAFSTNP